LIIAPWPQSQAAALDETAASQFGLLQEIVVRIRDARNQANVEPARRVQVILAAGEHLATLQAQSALIEFLARTEPPQWQATLATKPEQAMSLLAGTVEIYLPLAGLLDIGKELARLDKEIANVEQEIQRAEAKLANENFVARAKPEVVQKERDRLGEFGEKVGKLLARRAELATH
jgi:valyl-tRNA synthetase